jgi:anthranilate phosphoribosyltransferase
MIKEAINKAVKRENLTQQEAVGVMKEIMSGGASEAQISCLITALRMKGETIEEITGFAKTMREFAVKVKADITKPVVDTCGTGGDVSHTFNISTVSIFVVAGAGITVAKHGNRSVSSKCGSADLLEALGVKLDLPVEAVEKCLSEVGIAFLFAPKLHPAMKYAIGPRRQIGIRTVFNILGPLTNPAGANAQVLGVYSPDLVEPLANVLKNLGTKHSFVLHGNGLDEITLAGETKISEIVNGKVKTYTIKPEQYGMKKCSPDELKGGDAKQNLEILMDILKGKKGPKRDIVVLNAACAIVAGDMAKDMKQGIKLAEESIDSGRALKKLELLKEFKA